MSLRFIRLAFASALALFLAGSAADAQRTTAPEGTARWEELRDCRLLKNRAFDGDSFHVRHRGREYIFRLYGIDAPEMDTEFAERVDEQARHFGLNREQLLEVAGRARDHLAHALAQKFTVITRRENALGRSALPRFYGLVRFGTNDLSLDLVRAGLARRHGIPAPYPDRLAGQIRATALREAEDEAKEAGRGAWDRRRYLPSPTTVHGPAPRTPVRLDLNTATPAQLEGLPGIGPALAARIRAARPFRSVDALRDVPGIGPRTLELLRPHVRVGTSASAGTDAPP